MCGIVGYVGPDEAAPILLEGLRSLAYRGYDSAGVGVIGTAGLSLCKRAGRIEALEGLLQEETHSGTTGIGHTRWATHGAPTDANAHPHPDCSGRLAVIHNGIVENFSELRVALAKEGHELVSETDTECIAHLLESRMQHGLAAAMRETVAMLEGAFAVVAISSDEPGLVVGAKVSSPLVVGLGEGRNMLASDIPAVLPLTRTVIPVDEGQIVELQADSVRITTFAGEVVEPVPISIGWDVEQAEKSGFDDFMLKEIHEQPAAIRDTLAGRVDPLDYIALDELHLGDELLRDIDRVFVVACGTAYHAGLVAKYAIEHWTRLPVEIEIASEFRYRDPVLDANSLTLAVSQSGETIDTLEAARHAARQRSRVIAITNTVASSIARQADGILYTRAGPEIGVAATKTFATQMVALDLVALFLAQVRGTMFPEEVSDVLDRMRELPLQIETALSLADDVRRLAERLSGVRDCFFIGRHTGYPAALEGALKLKEISYIHAEAYPAGELKHGPIALIEDGTPVIAVATECHVYPKILSNIQEVRARGAEVIAIATEGDERIREVAQHVLFVPRVPELLAPVVVTVPLQLFAYAMAKRRGCDVDQPRNLAKSVTVE
jgi:glucosamine--fructose-6-phosphate aminotransferase (isomerizing)